VTPPDEATILFEAHRPRLVRLAYRMLGSMAEAEDIVQEGWLRWQRVDLDEVLEPSAFLRRIITRLCLDAMKSARARRETYVGSWLPEPVVEPQDDTTRPDELTLTLMLVLERLSPLERAAFLLHDVFGDPLDEIATALDRDAAAVRQLAVRARRHVRAARLRYPVAREEGDRMAHAFFTASNSGDLAALRSLLAQTVVLTADGGGKVHAFLNPIFGLDRVLRLYHGLHRKPAGEPASFIKPLWIDGLPGYASRERDGVLQTTAFEIDNGRIVAIYITRNPEKLTDVTRRVLKAGS
jgi:RNA polymerase sigma-70 factor (ECF subfamily)